MPVIREQSSEQKLPNEQRAVLVNHLVAELEGNATSGGPVIFEMPISQTDNIDVMVIWEKWQGIRPDNRRSLIKDAYKENADRLSLALGLTLQEAIDEGVLPFRARMSFQHQPQFSAEELRAAYLFAGACVGPEGRLELRFPTETIARAACDRLMEKLPGSNWITSYADT